MSAVLKRVTIDLVLKSYSIYAYKLLLNWVAIIIFSSANYIYGK